MFTKVQEENFKGHGCLAYLLTFTWPSHENVVHAGRDDTLLARLETDYVQQLSKSVSWTQPIAHAAVLIAVQQLCPLLSKS